MFCVRKKVCASSSSVCGALKTTTTIFEVSTNSDLAAFLCGLWYFSVTLFYECEFLPNQLGTYYRQLDQIRASSTRTVIPSDVLPTKESGANWFLFVSYGFVAGETISVNPATISNSPSGPCIQFEGVGDLKQTPPDLRLICGFAQILRSHITQHPKLHTYVRTVLPRLISPSNNSNPLWHF